jgi:hypothetical protein
MRGFRAPGQVDERVGFHRGNQRATLLGVEQVSPVPSAAAAVNSFGRRDAVDLETSRGKERGDTPAYESSTAGDEYSRHRSKSR